VRTRENLRTMTTYKTARICLNGHLIGFDKDVVIVGRPGLSRHTEGDRFCRRCGNEAITKCPSCDGEIEGEPDVTWMAADAVRGYSIPAFCPACGKSFPWTERKLEAAREAIEQEESFTEEQKTALKTDVEDIAGNTPRAQNAARRTKAILLKVGGTVGSAVRDIVVEVASEATKRILLGR
jgi:hypothetical protein